MGFIDAYCNFSDDGEAKDFQIDDYTIKITRGTYEFPKTLKEALEITPDISKEQYYTDYINRSGYQAFGMDYLCVESETCKFWESDYNSFVSLCKQTAGDMDMALISIWEAIFWPGAYNTSHEQLRDKVGTILLVLDESSGNIKFDIYTNEYHLSMSEGVQKLATLALVALYDCDKVIDICRKWWYDTEDIVAGIKKLFAE